MHLCLATTPEGRDECGVRDRDTGMERECSDGSICLLEGIVNRCVESKFQKIAPKGTVDSLLPPQKRA